MRICLQAIPHELVDHLARRFAFDAFNDFARERVNQHLFRCVQTHAARTEIKNALAVQLADGRAVRAFHIVRINLQLRLGIGRGVVGKEQVFIRLLGIGLLGQLADENAAMKHAFGFIIENAIKYS